jgi:hypothetical protein
MIKVLEVLLEWLRQRTRSLTIFAKLLMRSVTQVAAVDTWTLNRVVSLTCVGTSEIWYKYEYRGTPWNVWNSRECLKILSLKCHSQDLISLRNSFTPVFNWYSDLPFFIYEIIFALCMCRCDQLLTRSLWNLVLIKNDLKLSQRLTSVV